MKRIAFGSLTLAMAWVGGADPCSALPVFSPQPVAEAEAAFLLTRHRHHHHWRGHHRHSRRGGPASEELNQPAEGDSAPLSAYPAPETGTAHPPTAAPAETAPPPAPRRSTRWVNPDKRRG